MKNKSIPELDKLILEIGTYRKSQELKELFEFVKKFPHIAPYNAMLIHIQKPGSQYVASATEWERRFNRTVICIWYFNFRVYKIIRVDFYGG